MNNILPKNKQLYDALFNNRLDRLADYLGQGEYDSSDDALLILAIKGPVKEEAICRLIEMGWNPNARDPHFNEPVICLAAQRGMPAVVAALIAHGGDILATDVTGSNAALFACSDKSRGNFECLQLLISSGADVNQGRFYSPLMWAIS